VYTLKLLTTCGLLTKSRTYQAVAYHAFGQNGTRVGKFFLFINLFGTIIAYSIIIGNLMQPAVQGWANTTEKHFYTDALFLSGVMIVGFVVPLAFFSKIQQLEKTSAIALISVFAVLILVLWRSIEKLIKDGKHVEMPTLFNWNLVGVSQALPMIAFALGCQTQVIPIYAELRDDLKERGQMTVILMLGNISCSAIYEIIAFFGYLEFGSTTNEVILDNYGQHDVLANIARVSMVSGMDEFQSHKE
jgi:amino acid permease